MLKCIKAAILIATLVSEAVTAQAPADTLARLDTIVQHLTRIGRESGGRIWPGFRPDTIPVVFVLPTHGSIILNWPGAVPDGYQAIAGRSVAQVVVSSLDPSVLLPTTVHEAFHVFESGKDFGSCSFDPQNLLQVTTTMQLHTRTWKPCSGSALVAEFNVPAVHDRTAGTIRAVIGTDAEVKISIAGAAAVLADGQSIDAAQDVRIEAPRASVQSARANVCRSGHILRITPLL